MYSHTDNKEMDGNEMTSGFCYINNIAVAAAYLKNIYRDKIK